MTSAFVLPRARVLAVAVAATLLALVAWQVTAARPLNASGATAGVLHITMTVTGVKTGLFKGDDGGGGKVAPGTITVLAYSYGLQETIGSGTGGAGGEGKVTQKPVTITHTMGGSSPEFLGAAATGERLTSVVISFSRTDFNGKLAVFYRVTLTNAFVSEVSQRATGGDMLVEDVSFIFQKIEQHSITQNTTFIEMGASFT